MTPGALRQRHLEARQPVAVRRHRAQHVDVTGLGGMQIDAVEVIARLLGGNGETRAVDQVAQLARLQREGMRQIGLPGRGKVLARQGRKREHRAPRLDLDLTAVAGARNFDLGALGQLADDIVEHMYRRRGRARLADLGRDRIDDGQIHVGRGQRQPPRAGVDQNVGENRDGIAALDGTLYMGQGLEQRSAFDGQLHGVST
jgi:hypothetical protein